MLVGHDLAEAFHFCSAVLDDVGYAVVVRGQSTLRQILMFKNTFQAGAFLPARGVRLMAAVAIVVVKPAALCLLRVEAELGVGLAALDIAASDSE